MHLGPKGLLIKSLPQVIITVPTALGDFELSSRAQELVWASHHSSAPIFPPLPPLLKKESGTHRPLPHIFPFLKLHPLAISPSHPS